jgi:hypothetical protein
MGMVSYSQGGIMNILQISKSALPSFIQLISLAYNIRTREDIDKELQQWANIIPFLVQSDPLQPIVETTTVSLKCSLSTLSSLCIGSLSFSSAYQNGLATLSDLSWIPFFTTLFTSQHLSMILSLTSNNG